MCPARRSSAGEAQQTGLGGPESAGLPVECRQVGLVVDVKPFASCRSGLVYDRPDQAQTDTAPRMVGVNDRVQQEGVCPTVPAGMDEAAQLIAVEGAYPRDGVTLEPPRPGNHLFGDAAEGPRVQTRQNPVVNREPDAELQPWIHGTTVEHLNSVIEGELHVTRADQARATGMLRLADRPKSLAGRWRRGCRWGSLAG